VNELNIRYTKRCLNIIFHSGCTKNFKKFEKREENFLDVIFGILFISVPPKHATRPDCGMATNYTAQLNTPIKC
jgi:nitric oxide synthase oxygenase domain/subunit